MFYFVLKVFLSLTGLFVLNSNLMILVSNFEVTINHNPYLSNSYADINNHFTLPSPITPTNQLPALDSCNPNATLIRVSVASDGTIANGNSSFNASTKIMSHDGRYVVFASDANNLSSDDTNGFTDVFVHDRVSCITSRVSVSSSGAQSNGDSGAPVISSDGLFVAFWSNATNLVPNDTNNWRDIFVHDMKTGETKRVSVASNGTQGNWTAGSGEAPSISADGRYVAFSSWSSNLVNNDTNTCGYSPTPGSCPDIFVHDTKTGETKRVSVASDGAESNGASTTATISSNGQFVVFGSEGTTLVKDDTTGGVDTFVHDMWSHETSRASIATNGTPSNGSSYNWPPVISADGRFVLFVTTATNLALDTNVCGGWNTLGTCPDIYIRDRKLNKTYPAAVLNNGALMGPVDGQTISDDGRFMTINQAPYYHQSYIRDLQMPRTIPIINDYSTSIVSSISPDGQFVAFSSDASSLVSGGTSGQFDVYVARVQTNQVGNYKQTSSPWSNDPYDWYISNSKKLSRGNWTVKGSGCFITSVVNVMHYWGVTTDVNGLEVNPRNMNDYLSQLNAYNSNGGANWGAIAKYVDRKIQISNLPIEGQTKEQAINAQLALIPPQPVMVGVPFGGQQIDGHWVVITGPKINGHYPISDPGGKGATDLGVYGDENAIGTMRLVKPTISYIPQQTIVVHSPVELMITDSLGRRTGYNAATQTLLNEIPKADYMVEQPIVDQVTGLAMGEAEKVLRVSQSTVGQYQLTVTGVGNGHYGLDFQTMDVNGNLASQSQEGIASIGSTTEYGYTYDGGNIALDQQLVANAGLDQTSIDSNNNGSEPISLNGSGSRDNNGTIVSYMWMENGVTIASGINPIRNFLVGTHSVTLIVMDDNGVQNSDNMIITVLSQIQHPSDVPQRNHYMTNTPTLTWNRVSWAATYEVQISNTHDFNNGLYFASSILANNLSVTTSYLSNGTYYWHVRACPTIGVCGMWSATDSFTVDY